MLGRPYTIAGRSCIAEVADDDYDTLWRMAESGRGPDITRDIGGFKISCTFKPSLRQPRSATVTVETACGTVTLDTLEVEPSRALEVFRHTCVYSAPLAEALK